MRPHVSGMGPLSDGQTVAVVGGGPAGVGCAIALRRIGQALQRDVEVVLYEGKSFRGLVPHYNQCAGVLSPPIRAVLETALNVPFPDHLVQRHISRYVLHSDRQAIVLEGNGEQARVVRRVQFDDYLLGEARSAGVTIVNTRVVDLERQSECVLVYSDSDSRRADVVIGAFGLDDGSARAFQRVMDYRQPGFLTSIVTKVHPKAAHMQRMGNAIHAFLPGLRDVEFGAMTPKGNHITINIAGSRIDARSMDRFLALPAVRRLLPKRSERDEELGTDDLLYFKGKFPVGLARRYFGDRLAIIGDAAGLIRPFKGKGVTAGCASGASIAKSMFTRGISARAFADFYRLDPYCREIRSDMPYAKALRWLAGSGANHGYIDVVISLARKDAALRRALYDSVAAGRTYRQIVQETVSAPLVLRGVGAFASWLLRSKSGKFGT